MVVSRAPSVGTVLDRLRAYYGDPAPRTPNDPLDELIATILSQHTSDTNTARAFASLKARFPTWDAAVEAPAEAVAEEARAEAAEEDAPSEAPGDPVAEAEAAEPEQTSETSETSETEEG